MDYHETVDVKSLSVHYHGNLALKNVSFTVNKGSIVGVIGPNGAGKSTLMKAMLGLERCKGTVSFFGEKVKDIRKNIAYVPQRSSIDWDFPVLVKDVVLMGRFMHIPWYKIASKKDKERAFEALRMVGMEEFANRQIGELSGGQQQRVFIARSLSQDADLFFLDEPFVGIDVKSEEIIVDILHTLKQEGKTIFVIHHDLSKVEKYFDQLVLLNQELIHAGEVKDVYRTDLIKKAYHGSASLMKEGQELVVVNP
ncbi:MULTISPECIES: metal ABC transporter ATP-binding protein [Bacillaceae]|uniref:Metal ABC transporter ATP-binding protein n=1 Tax=Evansella alkalicola TaxID=745819 RepID=A0ABS6JXV4_9BACI|nr:MULTISPECIES: metal ABC transporter ATP-binding protein [Bacillaceae]MBU9722474.1 metal ABC transporter ATP-binding protein [Bacillus alkalicola]